MKRKKEQVISKKLNDAVEWNIRNIPDKVTVTEKVSHSCFWFIHWNTYRTREELNPYREIDHDYYDKVIRARLSRISIQEDKENKKKAILKELNDYMSDLKGQFNRTAGQLQVLQDELPSKIGVIDGQIDLALKQIEQLNKDEKDIENKVGLEGNTLVKCLSDVKLFGKTLHGGATAYSPLASVMNEVKDIVQIDFDLLETGETPDVYLASSNLLHRVKFLNKLALGSQKMFQVSADYKKITDSQEFKTLALEYSA